MDVQWLYFNPIEAHIGRILPLKGKVCLTIKKARPTGLTFSILFRKMHYILLHSAIDALFILT